jgi:hypothetical protein
MASWFCGRWMAQHLPMGTVQVSRSGRVTNRLTFHFKDGSIHEETVVYTQRGQFHLVSEHMVQRGPMFKRPMETTLDTATGKFAARFTDDDGKEKVETEMLKTPEDVANGLVFTLLKNIRPEALRTTVSMVAATPKARIVKLVITPQGEEPFSVGESARKAMHFVIKVDLGGVAGVVAPLVGKQPRDVHVWVLEGDAPAFIKSELPLYQGGPVWRIELATPKWE